MRVKPTGELPDVPRHAQPAVLATGLHLHSHIDTLLLGPFLKPRALLQRRQGVFVAMMNQNERHVKVDMVDR